MTTGAESERPNARRKTIDVRRKTRGARQEQLTSLVSHLTSEEIADPTITISGYSKTYSITGWRVGYCVCSPRWAERIGHLNDLIYICAPAPLQDERREMEDGRGRASQ